MSNWDLIMPGAGLTAIGLAGLVTSYSGIAHTFIAGMHALTGLLTMFGLIMVLVIVVDDAIIVVENVKRYIQKGLQPKEAAIVGAKEVA